MKTIIYYFSATGNSFFVAKRLSTLLHADIISMGALISQTEIQTEAEAIGLVFPVYYAASPVIVTDFVRKIKEVEKKYIFTAITFGGGIGDALKQCKKSLKTKNGRISLAYGIHLPQNGFYKKSENHEKLNEVAIIRCKQIADKVKAGKKGVYHHSLLIEGLIKVINPVIFQPLVKSTLRMASGLHKEKNLEKLIHFTDNGFRSNDKCNSCGICSKVCPVSNINIVDGKPEWQHKCENCLACYHWCPNHAIEVPICEKGYYYRNKDIKLEDIITK